MDIKELDKRQLILLTLLISFVVSIATGIVTVSLMNQMPKSVPQTINNVIQRTIEKVTTVQVPVPDTNNKNDNEVVNTPNDSIFLVENSDALISIYPKNVDKTVSQAITPNTTATPTDTPNTTTTPDTTTPTIEPIAIGQGVIISDIGLVLVDSSILTPEEKLYKVILNKKDFDATVLKSFGNGFTILRISTIKDRSGDNPTDKPVDNTTANKTQ